jgi:hypothetical protein
MASRSTTAPGTVQLYLTDSVSHRTAPLCTISRAYCRRCLPHACSQLLTTVATTPHHTTPHHTTPHARRLGRWFINAVGTHSHRAMTDRAACYIPDQPSPDVPSGCLPVGGDTMWYLPTVPPSTRFAI